MWQLAGDGAATFKLHDGRVTGLAVCPDGLTALSAGSDGAVKQFDLATGRTLRT